MQHQHINAQDANSYSNKKFPYKTSFRKTMMYNTSLWKVECLSFNVQFSIDKEIIQSFKYVMKMQRLCQR